MNNDSERSAIEQAIIGPRGADAPLLVGWVLVAEFADLDGRRILARFGSETLTDWQRDGYLHNALFGPWNAEDDDEDGGE